jgi:hypothetical protein
MISLLFTALLGGLLTFGLLCSDSLRVAFLATPLVASLLTLLAAWLKALFKQGQNQVRPGYSPSQAQAEAL